MGTVNKSWRETPAKSAAGALLALRREIAVRLEQYPKLVRKGRIGGDWARWQIDALVYAEDVIAQSETAKTTT